MQKRGADLLEHYNLYFLLRVLKANMIALNACSLNLTEILQEEKDYKRFMSIFNASVSKVVSEGYNEEFEKGEQEEETRALWHQIYTECKSIMTFGLALIYTSIPEVLSILQESLDKRENVKKAEFACIVMRYVSIPENTKKLLDVHAERPRVLKIFEIAAEIRAKSFADGFSKLNLDPDRETEWSSFKDNELALASESFMVALSQLFLMECSSSYENKHTSAEERNETDGVLNLVFRTMTGAASTMLEAFSTKLQTLNEELEKSEGDAEKAKKVWARGNRFAFFLFS